MEPNSPPRLTNTISNVFFWLCSQGQKLDRSHTIAAISHVCMYLCILVIKSNERLSLKRLCTSLVVFFPSTFNALFVRFLGWKLAMHLSCKWQCSVVSCAATFCPLRTVMTTLHWIANCRFRVTGERKRMNLLSFVYDLKLTEKKNLV